MSAASDVIDIQQLADLPGVSRAVLSLAALATLRAEQVEPPVEMTILLTDDDALRDLNNAYRGYNDVTDVLSFASESIPGLETRYLGDIAISVPQAARQAAAGGHSLQAELQLLIVHGTLHLLGFDHEDDEEQARMWARQALVLSTINAEITAPPSQV